MNNIMYYHELAKTGRFLSGFSMAKLPKGSYYNGTYSFKKGCVELSKRTKENLDTLSALYDFKWKIITIYSYPQWTGDEYPITNCRRARVKKDRRGFIIYGFDPYNLLITYHRKETPSPVAGQTHLCIGNNRRFSASKFLSTPFHRGFRQDETQSAIKAVKDLRGRLGKRTPFIAELERAAFEGV